MALTRKSLKAIGCTDEQAEHIIELHTESFDGIKAERDSLKEQLKEFAEVQKQLEKANSKLDAYSKSNWEEKYNLEHSAFEEFKNQIETEKANANKTNLYKDLLKEAGITDKRIDSVMKATNLNDFEFDENGIKDRDTVLSNIKTEWADFIPTVQTVGANTPKPPKTVSTGSMTKEQILAITDRDERKKAIAENIELFN